jgi:hypothetical protein
VLRVLFQNKSAVLIIPIRVGKKRMGSKLTRSRPLPARKPNLQRSAPIRLRCILKPILLNKLLLRRETRRLAEIRKQALPIPPFIPKRFPRIVVRSRASSVSHTIDDRAAAHDAADRQTNRAVGEVCLRHRREAPRTSGLVFTQRETGDGGIRRVGLFAVFDDENGFCKSCQCCE